MRGRDWTRDQLVKALALYCQLPFGKMHWRNPAIVALAEAIGRTPSAVSLKLVNFASLDPDLRERGVRGMGNVSQADRTVWEEFFGQWDRLAANAVVAVDLSERAPPRSRTSKPLAAPVGPTEVVRETAVRRGQRFFRSAVLAAHDCQCCITGITSEPLLRASHIVPWAADPTLRLDPRNGLCMNALHDAAFDRGLITLSDQFEMRISKRLKNEVPANVFREMFACRDGEPIKLPERFLPEPRMLEFHRTRIFCA